MPFTAFHQQYRTGISVVPKLSSVRRSWHPDYHTFVLHSRLHALCWACTHTLNSSLTKLFYFFIKFSLIYTRSVSFAGRLEEMQTAVNFGFDLTHTTLAPSQESGDTYMIDLHNVTPLNLVTLCSPFSKFMVRHTCQSTCKVSLSQLRV